jgi:hypothetical protein
LNVIKKAQQTAFSPPETSTADANMAGITPDNSIPGAKQAVGPRRNKLGGKKANKFEAPKGSVHISPVQPAGSDELDDQDSGDGSGDENPDDPPPGPSVPDEVGKHII